MRPIILIVAFGLAGCDFKKRDWSQSETPTQVTQQETTPKPTPKPTPEITKTKFSDITPLFEKHCMICHGTNLPKIDFLNHKVAVRYIDNGKLYERIWTLKDDRLKSMPLGNSFKMTDAERKLIIKWIQDGGLP